MAARRSTEAGSTGGRSRTKSHAVIAGTPRSSSRSIGGRFETAVTRQLMSDRPVGVMLSGGVDSAAITAVMAEKLPEVRTFSIGFAEGGDTNELPLARQTARMFGTRHEERLISSAEYLRDLPTMAAQIEEPVGASSALAVRYVAAMMNGTVPVALTGQGADEPLAGYWRHLGTKVAWQLRGLRASGVSTGATRWVRVRRGRQTLLETADPLRRMMRAYELFSSEAKRRLYSARSRRSPARGGASRGLRRTIEWTGRPFGRSRADAIRRHAHVAPGRVAVDRRQDVDGRVR